MNLRHLSLLNYKNIESTDYTFDPKINCFTGPNGVGKTNVLDAIYHLAHGKSYFNPLAAQNIRHGEEFFVIDGDFDKAGSTQQIVCSLKKGQKKVLKRNGKPYEKFSEHVGFIPLVIISPYDIDLITEGSETRRSFIDSVISVSDNTYLQQLIGYQKVLAQRNALLKYFALNHTFDYETLSIYNGQLENLGQPIFETRRKFLEDFIPIFNKHHHAITDAAEDVSLAYESRLYEKGLAALLEESLPRDRVLQYTSVGIHKDDLAFTISGHPIKKFGSQGQQKSYLIALKLAQFEFIRQKSGVLPILLFDDIFDKLDETRVARIVSMIDHEVFGQIFITDTHAERTEAIIKEMHQSYTMFRF